MSNENAVKRNDFETFHEMLCQLPTPRAEYPVEIILADTPTKMSALPELLDEISANHPGAVKFVFGPWGRLTGIFP